MLTSLHRNSTALCYKLEVTVVVFSTIVIKMNFFTVIIKETMFSLFSYSNYSILRTDTWWPWTFIKIFSLFRFIACNWKGTLWYDYCLRKIFDRTLNKLQNKAHNKPLSITPWDWHVCVRYMAKSLWTSNQQTHVWAFPKLLLLEALNCIRRLSLM